MGRQPRQKKGDYTMIVTICQRVAAHRMKKAPPPSAKHRRIAVTPLDAGRIGRLAHKK
jgi:hypothetical protein